VPPFLFVFLSLCLFVFLSFCLFVFLSLCLWLCLCLLVSFHAQHSHGVRFWSASLPAIIEAAVDVS